ncbi:MAG: sigma-70 family RNA polymerase sigma factor [Planctomycetota bacterium]|nr:MAG: sigma-70 family RNA polymerase sigma factor [Planctomycetota bacterium]
MNAAALSASPSVSGAWAPRAWGSRRARSVAPPESQTRSVSQDDRSIDAALVLRARDGDDDAFRELVERYQQRVFWVARGLLGNDEDARDAAQDAFVRVHRALDRFDTTMRFYTWLYQIVVNRCIDKLRRRSKRQAASLDAVGEVAGEEANHGEALEREELRQRVLRVLDRLPPKYKTVMVLSDLEGIGAKEIAEITGTTHANVRWRHHRARKLFRAAWEETYGKGSHALL